MSEETKQDNVTISEETVQEINQEIEKVEEQKLDAAKVEGANSASAEVKSSIDSLKEELAAIRAENAKREEAAEEARLKAELESEKRKAADAQQAVQRQAVVPDSTNPTQTSSEPAPQAEVPRDVQWAELEAQAKSGGFRATVDEQ